MKKEELTAEIAVGEKVKRKYKTNIWMGLTMLFGGIGLIMFETKYLGHGWSPIGSILIIASFLPIKLYCAYKDEYEELIHQ